MAKNRPKPEQEVEPLPAEIKGTKIPQPIPEPVAEPEAEMPVRCYRCNQEFSDTDVVLATGLYTDNKPAVRVFHKNCAIHAYARNGWGALYEI